MNRNFNNYHQGQRRQSGGGGGGYNQQFSGQPKPFLSGGYLNRGMAQQTEGQVNPVNRQTLRPPAPAVQATPVLPEVVQMPQMKQEDFSQDDAIMTPVEKQTEKVEESSERSARARSIIGLAKKKISNKERRIRQNRRLRKMLTPKNAIVALHELQGPSALDFQIEGVNNDFRAEVNVNNIRYIGTGRSKVLAKNNAAEKALRDFVIARMAAKARRVKEEKSIEAGEAEMKESTEPEDADDVPMLNLVSFALHKLFCEWEAEGFPVPDFRAGQEVVQPMAVDNGAEMTPVKQLPQPRDELPNNAASTHPTMLLSIMNPGTQFTDVGSEGKPPHVVHTVSVSLCGKDYVGTGRTKKLARKNAALEACMDCYGVQFNADIISDTQ
ncbi:double-stranded RNA-specific editase B2-like isoform X2 [Phlebotomus argentipes]|uniref:double-stranded RNA-specific editase B2-like isoform X2 n=1 Tax=Phlebotomus argentipes TaxID=94469 RepID=UPI00289329C0|nr:double-stranded RNA-specific editase B2-like isoform X2 [Phlebotomus argentipes]